MAKGERTRARTVEKFLDAGLEVFAERGFHAASMDEICARAELSRGAFYSNFSGKEALFLALFDRHAETQIGRITAVIDAADSLESAIAAAARAAAHDDPDERRWALLSTEFTIYAARDGEAEPNAVAGGRVAVALEGAEDLFARLVGDAWAVVGDA